MQKEVYPNIIAGIIGCLLVILMCIPVSGVTNETDTVGYAFRVQEDPFFTFGYPDGMSLNVTSENGRNTYLLTTEKNPPVSLVVTSTENAEWAPLPEESLSGLEQSMRNSVFQTASKNLTPGSKVYNSDENLSSYFVSYLDPDSRELIYSNVLSTNDTLIFAFLTEPAGLYQTEYGNFTLKSVLSITPRSPEQGFTYQLAGNDKNIETAIKNLTKGPETKDFVYDPYVGLYMDTDTGYYYIPQYGVFYDPKTGNIYYPGEFGTYDTDFFKDYAGLYSPSGTGTGGYYDGLYSGYTGYSGYDASDVINDAYQNRQNVYDAANAMWDDYILDNQYYTVDSSGYTEPIDTIQEYQDYDLS